MVRICLSSMNPIARPDRPHNPILGMHFSPIVHRGDVSDPSEQSASWPEVESRLFKVFWTPAFAGVTVLLSFA